MWCDSPNSAPKYNADQDKDVSGMLAKCSFKGKIDTMPDIAGILVFMAGHVGIYIGNGKVIEARGHSYGVVETELKKRAWSQWGKLDWINYVEDIKMFEDGEELKALDYLVEQGRIEDKEYWLKTLDVVKNQKWALIKWANDVKKLNA